MSRSRTHYIRAWGASAEEKQMSLSPPMANGGIRSLAHDESPFPWRAPPWTMDLKNNGGRAFFGGVLVFVIGSNREEIKERETNEISGNNETI